MQKKQQIRNSTADFLIFAMQGDAEGIEVRLEDDTVWRTQQMHAELYGTTKQNTSLHILNIYEEELSREATVKDFMTVRNEGTRKVNRRLEYRVASKKTVTEKWMPQKYGHRNFSE